MLPARKPLLLDILLPVLLALGLNGIIVALGWTRPDHDRQPAFAPPGYVIGIVWTCLFACMGAARAMAIRSGDRRDARLATVLIALCLAYPFYTAGLQDRMAGLAGIAVTGAFALAVVFHAWTPARATALLLVPLIAWLCFAALLIMTVNRLNP